AASYRRIRLDAPYPITDAIRCKVPIFIDTAAIQKVRYPRLACLSRKFGWRSVCALPLLVRARSIGAIGLTFNEDRRLDEDEKAFLSMLARECAQALDRARLYGEAQEAIRLRDEFLGIAGHELKTPLTALTLGVQSLAKHIGENPDAAKRLEACARQVER